MAHGVGVLRRSRAQQHVLLATLGHGGKLYRKGKAQYAEGMRGGDETRLRWAAQIFLWAVRKGATNTERCRALVALGACAAIELWRWVRHRRLAAELARQRTELAPDFDVAAWAAFFSAALRREAALPIGHQHRQHRRPTPAGGARRWRLRGRGGRRRRRQRRQRGS